MKLLKVVFACFLMLMMVATPFASAQEATPVVDNDPPPPPVAMGSITVEGLSGEPGPQYSIVDSTGEVLTSGSLESPYVESNSLATSPGHTATLTTLANKSYQSTSVSATANDEGALHFVVQLLAVEPGESTNAIESDQPGIQNRTILLETDEALSPETGDGTIQILNDGVQQVRIIISASTGDGSIPAEVSFFATLQNDDDWFYIDDRTNADGESVVNLKPGAYWITVSSEGRFLGGEFEFTVDSETTEVPIAIGLAESTGFVQFNPAFDGEPSDTGGYFYVYSSSDLTYSANLTTLNPTIIELPVGSYSYDAHPNDSLTYHSSDGDFTVTQDNGATSPLQVSVLFTKNPTVEFSVVDSESKPIAGVEVELGSVYDGIFSTSTIIQMDDSGQFALPLPDWITHWRILPYDLWQGASGQVSSPRTSITLNPLTEFGTVTFELSHDDGEYLYGAFLSGAGDDDQVYQSNGNSNQISMYLPAGDWEFSAETSAWGYYPAEVTFKLGVGEERTIPVVFESWPEHTFVVQDGNGNPIRDAHVQIGFSDGGNFYEQNSVYSDESGSGVLRMSDNYTRWNVAPFDLWQGSSGSINGDTTQIVLQSISESGTLKIDATGSNAPWFEIEIVGDAGWHKWINLYSSSPDEQVAEVELPVGEYSWNANAGYGYHQLSGEFAVDVDGHHDLGTLTFEPQPLISITVVDQANNPVPDVRIVFDMQDEPWAWGEVYSDADGQASINLPLGGFSYSIDAPAKYQLQDRGVLEHVSSDGSTLNIELVLLPNGTLEIDVVAPEDYPVNGYINILDGNENYLASSYVQSSGLVAFQEFPYGSDYTIYLSGSFWYPETSSETFEFGEESGPVSFELIPYEPIQLNVEVSSTSGSPIRSDFSLQLDHIDLWYGTSLWLSGNTDGSYGGSVTLPRTVYTVSAFWWDGTTSPDLPLVLDLTEAASPHTIQLQITPPPGGKPVFTISSPDGFSHGGEIGIFQDDARVSSAWIDTGSSTATTYDVLDAGTYTWMYQPGGALQAASGSFTITEGDVVVPVDLKVGLNGVITVSVEFPVGLGDLSKAGWASVYDSDGNWLADRYLDDLTTFAIGPVTYGDVTLRISPQDSRLIDPDETIVNVNAESVTASVTLVLYEELDPVILTITVTSEGEALIRGGQVHANGASYEIGDDGTVEVDVAGFNDLYFYVTSVNFETAYEQWHVEDGLSKEVQLGEQMPVIELTIQDEDGADIPGLNVHVISCPAGVVGASEGLYLLRAWDPGATECTVSVVDPRGLYQPIENELFSVTGLLTQVALTLTLEPNLVDSVEIHLSIEDGMPEIDWEAGEVFRVGMRSVDGSVWVEADVDSDGVATFPALRPGEYSVQVYGAWETWRYDLSALYDTSVEVTTSGQEIEITIPKVPLYPVIVRIETSDGLAADAPVRVGVTGTASVETEIDAPGEGIIYLPRTGMFYFHSNGTAFYNPGEPQRFQAVEDGQIVTLTLIRISAVPVPVEPEPSETPTAPPTDVTTPTVTVTPTGTSVAPPEETPVVVPTETETPVIPGILGDKQLIVRFQLPGGQGISGAPYKLYSPMAAQFSADPLLQGIVGPNNTLRIDGLIPGTYRLVVEPVGMVPIDVLIDVGDDPVTEAFVVRLEENGETTVSYVRQQAQPTAPDTGDGQERPLATPGSTEFTPGPTEAAVEPGLPHPSSEVTGLPSTGAGQSGGMGYSVAILLAAVAASFIAIPLGIEKNRRQRR